jgi:hypothetical protein
MVGLLVGVMGWVSLVQASTPEGAATGQIVGSTRRAWNVEEVGQIGGQARAVDSQGNYAYVVTNQLLVVLDISNPADPVRVGAHEIAGLRGRDVAVDGDYAYLAAADAGLRVVDISDPTRPVEVGFDESPGDAFGITVAGGYAYVVDITDRLRIFDVSDPAHPTPRGVFRPSLSDRSQSVAVTSAPGKTYAYAGYRYHLYVVDVTDPDSPSELGNYATRATDVAADGSLAYVTAGDDGLLVIDASEPLTPTLVDTLDTPGSAMEVVLAGNQAYVADGTGGLRVIDIADPGNLAEDGSLPTPDSAMDVALLGEQALVACGERGLRVINVSAPASPAEKGAYDPPTAARSVAISGTYAYVGDYYYDPGDTRGALRSIDVSDPANPELAGVGGLTDRATGLALGTGYAFMSGYYEGMMVADISNPLAPTEVISYPTSHLGYDIAVVGSHAYLGETKGLYIFDVSTPASPVKTGFWPTPGNAISRVAAAGSAVYAGAGRDGLHILDVSEPMTPTVTGVYTVDEYISDVTLHGDLVYLAASDAGLLIVDVSNPVSPTMVGVYEGVDIVKGVAISELASGQILAYLTAEHWDDHDYSNRLAVVDVTDPANPGQVGYHELLTEAQSVEVAEAGPGEVYAYVANQGGGLAIYQLRIRVYLPVVLRGGP